MYRIATGFHARGIGRGGPRIPLLGLGTVLSCLLAACSSDSPAPLGGNSTSGTAAQTSGSGTTTGNGGSTADGGGSTGADARPAGQGLEGGVENACGTVSIPATVEVSSDEGNVLILFDQSNSMTKKVGGFGGSPLWQAASDAVAQALDPHEASLTAGAVFFPTAGDLIGSCHASSVADINTPPQIPFQPGPDFLDAWAARWTSAGLQGTTPTERALVVGEAAIDQAGLAGPTAVIVVTDGASTCFASRPRESEDVAAEWLTEGIKTYVVGLGGFAAQGELESIARAGGTQSAFTPADGAALATELGDIFTQLVRSALSSCVVTFDEVPNNLEEIDLVVTEATTGDRFRIPQGPDGWQVLPNNTGARLEGKACTDALNGRFSTVSFDFGCGSVPLI